MEAIAKHNFDATSQDELGFRKGQVLKVFKIEEEEEGKWIKAEMDGMEGMIPSNYIQIKSQTWFRGEITRAEAEAVLSDKPDGGFLIRISESSPDFSLSVKCPAGVQHFKVLRDTSCKFFIWFVKFNSLNELVEYHRTSSIVRSQDVRLKDLLPEYGKALYDFKAEEPGELEFKKGDIITVTNSSNKHWWTGTLRSKRGQFPAKYVTQYKP